MRPSAVFCARVSTFQFHCIHAEFTQAITSDDTQQKAGCKPCGLQPALVRSVSGVLATHFDSHVINNGLNAVGPVDGHL